MMKFKACIRQAAGLTGFAITITAAAAQTVGIPSKLSGRWMTLDGAASQSISANIHPEGSRSTLTVWSTSPDCIIHDAPIAVIAGAEKMVLKVDASYSNPCRADVIVELTKKAGSEDYEGELRQGGPAGARFPVLRVKMSP